MATNDSTLQALLSAVNYAEYALSVHHRSHALRGSGGGQCCDDHEDELADAEAALRAFQAAAELAA